MLRARAGRSTSENDTMRLRIIQPIALIVTSMALLGGCANRTATFPGHSDPEVWNAMVTVAENPVYDDWHVFENEVMAARPEGRIEIYRILRRDLVRVGQDPIRQEEAWRFNVQFLQTEPPTIRFITRQAAVPAHLWREADRYFADMRTILARQDSAVSSEVLEVESDGSESDISEPEATGDPTLDDLIEADRI